MGLFIRRFWILKQKLSPHKNKSNNIKNQILKSLNQNKNNVNNNYNSNKILYKCSSS